MIYRCHKQRGMFSYIREHLERSNSFDGVFWHKTDSHDFAMHPGQPDQVLRKTVQCTAFDALLILQSIENWCTSCYFFPYRQSHPRSKNDLIGVMKSSAEF